MNLKDYQVVHEDVFRMLSDIYDGTFLQKHSASLSGMYQDHLGDWYTGLGTQTLVLE